MDKLKAKPVATLNWPESGGMSYGVKAGSIDVFLRCKDSAMHFSFIKAPFYPGDTPEQARLLFVCPFCSTKDLMIQGHVKTFQWELIQPPRPITVPGNPDAVQVLAISIAERCGCPSCRRFFKITNNVVHGV